MSDFSVFVKPQDAEPGMTVDLGTVTISDDCGGLNVVGYSDSVHVNNYLMIGNVRLDGTEGGVSNWLVDLPAGTYPVVYYLGERGLGEKPLGASFDFTTEEVECPVTTTSSTSSTSTSSTTSTTVPSSTTTSLPPGSTTTTEGTTTTTGGDTTTTTIVTSTTSVPPNTPTLPETGPTDMVGLAMMAVALITGGIAILNSRRLSNA